MVVTNNRSQCRRGLAGGMARRIAVITLIDVIAAFGALLLVAPRASQSAQPVAWADEAPSTTQSVSSPVTTPGPDPGGVLPVTGAGSGLAWLLGLGAALVLFGGLGVIGLRRGSSLGNSR